MVIETRKHAQRYTELFGWPVVVLHSIDEEGICTCGDPECGSPGKHPDFAFSPHGVNSAVLLKEEVEQLPELGRNLGIALGTDAGGVMVLDIDHGPTATRLLNLDNISDYAAVRTGRPEGGVHFYFRSAGDVKTRNIYDAHTNEKLGELRGDGAYVVAPPSHHASGADYEWHQLPAGTVLPTLHVTLDPMTMVNEILALVGVEPRAQATTYRRANVPDGGVQGIPLSIRDPIMHNMLAPQLLRAIVAGTYRDDGKERSDRLWWLCQCIVKATLTRNPEMTIEDIDIDQLAGHALWLDQRAGWNKGTDWGDPERYAYQTAVNAVRKFHDPELPDDPDKLTARAALENEVTALRTEFVKLDAHVPLTEMTAEAPVLPPPDEPLPEPGDGDDDGSGSPPPPPPVFYQWDEGDGYLNKVTPTKTGASYLRISNFWPRILYEIEIEYGGGDQARAWHVAFKHADGSEFEVLWPASVRTPQAIAKEIFGDDGGVPAKYNVYPGMFDHVRAAMQESWIEKDVVRKFATTGWVEHEDRHVFLLPRAEGGIGPNGIEPNVRIDFDEIPEDEIVASDNFRQYGVGVRPAATPDEWKASWLAFADLIGCGPVHLTMPLALHVLAGPLYEAGTGDQPPLLHAMGRTGSLKTSLCFCVMSMFGTWDESTGATGSWSASPASKGGYMWGARHLTFLLDDYKASNAQRGDIAFIQNYSDGTSRGRMTPQQKLQRALNPRGILLSNGEDVWENEASADARTLLIDLKRGDVTRQSIQPVQDAVERGDMQLFGGTFLQWLARRYDEIIGAEVITELRKQWRTRLLDPIDDDATMNIHLRVMASVATLGAIGGVVFAFVKETYGEEHAAEFMEWLQTSTEYHRDAAIGRGKEIEELSPFRMFANRIVAAMGAREAHLFPRFGVTNERPRIPDAVHTDVIGFWEQRDGDPPGKPSIILSEFTSFRWLKRQLTASREPLGTSWKAVRQEAIAFFGGDDIYRAHVHTDTIDGKSVPGRVTGIIVPWSAIFPDDVTIDDVS